METKEALSLEHELASGQIERKYSIPPYKAADMIKRAEKIVNNLLVNSTSFTRPYQEAKAIIEIAQMLLDKVIAMQEEGQQK